MRYLVCLLLVALVLSSLQAQGKAKKEKPVTITAIDIANRDRSDSHDGKLVMITGKLKSYNVSLARKEYSYTVQMIGYIPKGRLKPKGILVDVGVYFEDDQKELRKLYDKKVSIAIQVQGTYDAKNKRIENAKLIRAVPVK